MCWLKDISEKNSNFKQFTLNSIQQFWKASLSKLAFCYNSVQFAKSADIYNPKYFNRSLFLRFKLGMISGLLQSLLYSPEAAQFLPSLPGLFRNYKTARNVQLVFVRFQRVIQHFYGLQSFGPCLGGEIQHSAISRRRSGSESEAVYYSNHSTRINI